MTTLTCHPAWGKPGVGGVHAAIGDAERMGSIARYIFRSTTAAFIVVLVSLTAIIWVSQALRDVDLMTNRGQSIAVFLGITSLLIPMLVMVIAPIALFIATAHNLNKLSSDSEIIVLNAAGMSPWLLFRAFLPVVLMVSVLVATLGVYLAPKGLRLLREWVTTVNANVVSTLVQPGRFVTIIGNVTINIAARDTNGQLRGVFIDDRRNPNDRITVIADRGDLLENQQGSFLVLQNGTVQRQDGQRDPNMVTFERYAVDLAQFSRAVATVNYSMHARYLWQLLDPDPSEAGSESKRAEIRAELFDRLMAPIYPFVFVIIAFAYLGTPRTTRENRTSAMIGAMGGILVVRLCGFVSTIFGVNYPIFLALQFVVSGIAIAGGLYAIRRGTGIEPPAFIKQRLDALSEWIARRFATG
jgi:lipopolysaccharide export system permease protein